MNGRGAARGGRRREDALLLSSLLWVKSSLPRKGRVAWAAHLLNMLASYMGICLQPVNDTFRLSGCMAWLLLEISAGLNSSSGTVKTNGYELCLISTRSFYEEREREKE